MEAMRETTAGGTVGRVALRLGEDPEPGRALDEIAAACRAVLGADRATCYAHGHGGRRVASVHTTERDPARRAFLEGAAGRGPGELPLWDLLVAGADPLMVIEDVANDPRMALGLARRLGSGALLGVRLQHASARQDDGGAALLGSLFCSYARPRRFSSEERRAVLGLAGLASLALANAHLQAQTAERLAEIRALSAEQEALRRVATEVAAVPGPEAIFGLAAAEAARLLGADAAIVARFDAQGATVVGAVGGHSEAGERLPTEGPGALARVAATGRGHAINDYRALPAGSALREHAVAHGYRASVAAPIPVAGRSWGAILATTKDRRGMPAAAEARLARFAGLIALAIANAEARAHLVAQAATDPLTGLANSRALFERIRDDLDRARRHQRPVSLVLMDLDRFKAVNDTYGHLVGDRVLMDLAGRLMRLARAEDTVARLGGDEFAWLLPEADVSAALGAAERARLAVAGEPFPEAGGLQLSAGVAEADPVMSADDLLRAADEALYAAKRAGRNRAAAVPDAVPAA